MMIALRILLMIAGSTVILGVVISSDEYEIFDSLNTIDNYIDSSQSNSLDNELNPDISSYSIAPKDAVNAKEIGFRPDYLEQYRITITPASGAAPLSASLLVSGIDQIDYLFWELDWNGDGQVDVVSQGSPYQQITYATPGNYLPVFNFYNDRNEMIAQAKGAITVTDNQLPSSSESVAIGDYSAEHSGDGTTLRMQDAFPGQAQASFFILDGFSSAKSNCTDGTASQSQALTAAPSGWGIVKDTQAPGDRRPAQNLDNGQNSWSPPSEEFTDYLRPVLIASTERGEAPLTVSFDASRTYSRYGVMRYNFDVIWGPHEAEDDGYYLYSGNSQQWTYTFEEYGMYLAILDVEDNSGNRARTTKVIFVL
jgi:PKD repeat protein